MLRKQALLALVFAACLPALQSTGQSANERNSSAPPQDSRPSVLLITLDTVRADHTGCYGYPDIRTPALDRLANEGVRFARAYAQVPITLPSHAVILTGEYPMTSRVRAYTSSGLPPEIPTLTEMMRRAGYQTAAFVSAFALHSMWGLNRGFDLYDDQMELGAEAYRDPFLVVRAGDVTTNHAVSWLDQHSRWPFFLWLHFYDAHSPYRSPQTYRDQYHGRPYDAAIAFDDAQVSRVIERLRQMKHYADTLIVVVSDHGESLGEHGEHEHGFFIYNSTLHVPLILKLPGEKTGGQVIEQPVGLIDLAPTIAQLCQIPSSETRSFQGSSLLRWIGLSRTGAGKPGEEESVYAESYYPHDSFGWYELRGIISRNYEFIEAPQPELYDLREPTERSNILAQNSDLASSMRAGLQAVEQKFESRRAVPAPTEPDSETLEKLKSLGYIAYQADTANRTPSPDEADPKSKITTFNLILRVSDLTRAGRYDEAVSLLENLKQREPGLYVLPFQSAEIDLAWGKPAKAVAEFRRALQLNPHFDQALLGLGRAYFQSGQDDKAATALNLALQTNPRNFLGRLALAKVYFRQNAVESSERELKRLIELQPGLAEAHALYGIILAKNRNYAEAEKEIKRGLDLGYHEAIAFNYLGVSQAETGRPREAIQTYQKALQLNPRYAAACMNLALEYRRLNDFSDAQRYYQKVCELNSQLCSEYASQFQVR